MWEQISANKRKSLLLVFVMGALLFAVGYLAGEMLLPGGGLWGIVIAFAIWTVMLLVSYYRGGDIFLAVSHAKRIEHADHPQLFNIVEEMVIAGGLPQMPAIYIIDDRQPNAFATGRDPEHAAVAVTSGLLSRLNRDELQGVIAHEISHIRNRDILLMVMVGVMLGTIVMITDVCFRSMLYGGRGRSRRSGGDSGGGWMIVIAIIMMILAPILAHFIYFAISRKREYLADASAVQLTRYPEGLASALEKISGVSGQMTHVNRVTAPMYISNPMGSEYLSASGLSRTHPPMQKRIQILREIAGGAGYGEYEQAYQSVIGDSDALISTQARTQSKKVEIREADAMHREDNQQERVRQATDLLWKLNEYLILSCPCGLKLKIPPKFKPHRIRCPHCKKQHEIGTIESRGR